MMQAPFDTPEKERAFLLHYARVHLREAIARRHDRGFAALLLGWAGKARRQAAAIDTRPAQLEMFG